MRGLTLLLVAVMNTATAKDQAVHPSSAAPVAKECAITNPSKDKPLCKNVLDANWQTSDLNVVRQNVHDMVQWDYDPPQSRKSSWGCRKLWKIGDAQSKKLSVSYMVPEDVNAFPTEPTMGKFLVVAVFDPVADEGCSEARYKVRKARDEWTRKISFMTVQTMADMPGHNPAKNETVTTWTMWTIAARERVPGVTEYRREKINGGEYVSCAGEHAPGKDWDFIGCDGAYALTAYLNANPGGAFSSIDEMLQLLKGRGPMMNDKRRSTVIKILQDARVSRFDAAAWMRCGYLGCCAAI